MNKDGKIDLKEFKVMMISFINEPPVEEEAQEEEEDS